MTTVRAKPSGPVQGTPTHGPVHNGATRAGLHTGNAERRDNSETNRNRRGFFDKLPPAMRNAQLGEYYLYRDGKRDPCRDGLNMGFPNLPTNRLAPVPPGEGLGDANMRFAPLAEQPAKAQPRPVEPTHAHC